MKIVQVMFAAYVVLLTPKLLNGAIQHPSITTQFRLHHLYQLLGEKGFQQHGATLIMAGVSFLPGNCIGGMRSPYDFVTEQANTTLLSVLSASLQVKTIISLTTKPLPSSVTSTFPEIEFYHQPIEDGATPSLEALYQIVRLSALSSPSSRLIIHCDAGIGRTGTVLAFLWYLFSQYPMRHIISLIRQQRPGSIELEQEAFLLALENDMIKYSEKPRIYQFSAIVGKIKET